MNAEKYASAAELAKLIRYVPAILTVLFELRRMMRQLRKEHTGE